MKNYTSGVPIERTISRIEAVLVRAGAGNIIKDYAEGELSALSFTLHLDGTRLVPIKLPANIEQVEKVMAAAMKRPRRETLRRIKQQAARTAWRLMQDWVEIQLSLIEMKQAEAMQVFLPYVWDGRQTYYAALKGSGFKLLPIARKDDKHET